MKQFRFICVLMFAFTECGIAQYYPLPAGTGYDQNATALPYPYQTALGLNPTPEAALPNPQNFGIPNAFGGPYPYPTGYGQPASNGYYALLAQQGIPAYQYPGMGYPGYPVYPQPYAGQGFGYPQFGYPQGGAGYPVGFGQPGLGYPQHPPKETGQQPIANGNIQTEILDVSPEYQRQLLGWPPGSSSGSASFGNRIEGSTKPRYAVDIDTQTSNHTVIPTNLTKPIITEKKFVTSIRRTFVYDSTKPENITPINIHIINGQQVTTTEPPTTTENEDVVENHSTSTVKPQGRRFMDVPKSCPSGTRVAHNGECIAPFLLRNPDEDVTDVPEDGTY